MGKKQVSVRLTEIELAQVDVMAFKSSREQWFRDMIRASARRQEPILEAAINGFAQAAKAAADDGDKAQASEYQRLIGEYAADLDTLRRGGT